MNARSAHERRFRLLALLVLVLLAVVAGGCGGDDDESAQQEAGQAGVLRMAQEEPPDPFDPATLGDNRTIELAQNTFDGLTAVDNDLNVVPALAESWEVSDDGTVYTFTLAEGATFQDGTPITAEAVVYSIDRALDPDVKSQYAFFLSVIQGATERSEGEADSVSGLRVVDDRTVEITLTQPAGYFPALAGMWPYWTIDQQNVAQDGTDWMNPPNLNGSGAFRLTDVVADNKYTFEAYEDYRGGAPELDRVEVTIVPDPAAQLARYRAGEFDIIRNLSAATYRQVQENEELRSQFHQEPLLRTVWINLLNSKPPFDDVRVRQAFSQAIDRDALVSVALGGLAEPAHTFLPPGLPGSVAGDRDPIPFDPEAAQQLLADAGFPGGEGFPQLQIHYSSGAEFDDVFEFVQNQLRENLGVEIGLRPMPVRAFNDLINDAERRPQMSGFSFGLDYPDPQEQHEYLGVSQPAGFANYGEYSNKRFDDLVMEANRTTDNDRRIELHEEAETLFLDEAAVVPLYHPVATWLAKPYVQGFTVTPLYMTRWTEVSVGGE